MRMDLMHIMLRERHSLPAEFDFFRWSCFPKNSDKTLYVEFEGAVAPFKTKGKFAGRRNWKKMDKTTRRTFHVTPDEAEAFAKSWSEKTGKCNECLGSGEVFKSWSSAAGTKYRTCEKCRGVGVTNNRRTLPRRLDRRRRVGAGGRGSVVCERR